MSFDEVLDAIPKLTFEQREEVIAMAMALNDDGELTPKEEAILDERMEDMRENPGDGMSLEAFKEKVTALLDERAEYFRQNPNSGIPLDKLDAELAARREKRK